VFPVKHFIYCFLSIFITEQSVMAVAEHRLERLACKATFAEEIALVQNALWRLPSQSSTQRQVLPFPSEYKKPHRTGHPEQISSAFLEKPRSFCRR
jgi:hypothetical protein